MAASTKKCLLHKDWNELFFHASSVNVSGKALLFLGHSTSGKSTISRLLSERYPIIADDKVRVRQVINGDWMVSDSSDNPPCIEKGIHDSVKQEYPLLAVMRIFKSKTTDIKAISAKETCKHLVDAVFEVDQQRAQEELERIKHWFSLAAEISKNFDGWRLTFTKDVSIIQIIYEKFD